MLKQGGKNTVGEGGKWQLTNGSYRNFRHGRGVILEHHEWSLECMVTVPDALSVQISGIATFLALLYGFNNLVIFSI
jgi:hypothetical protein